MERKYFDFPADLRNGILPELPLGQSSAAESTPLCLCYKQTMKGRQMATSVLTCEKCMMGTALVHALTSFMP